MTPHQEEIFRHTMKAIANSWRRHNEYTHGMIDSMYREFNLEREDWREEGERRNGNDRTNSTSN